MPDSLGPKGAEVLHDILPQFTHMAALYRENNAGAVIIVHEVEWKGAVLTLVRSGARPERLSGALEIASCSKSEAFFIMDDGAITKHREEIPSLGQSACL
jgi:hypothetical protein